jgi:hypothetical protein
MPAPSVSIFTLSPIIPAISCGHWRLEPGKQWPLTSLKEKLIKTCAKAVSRGRYVALRVFEVAVPREWFQEILRLIDGLRPRGRQRRTGTAGCIVATG